MIGYHCLCVDPNAAGGDGSGDGGSDKVCIDVRKKKTCKSLEYCNYDRKSSPMCTDKTPGVKIPIKEFCEAIPTRGWCKRVEECLWTGQRCVLKSEATCGDFDRKRTCHANDDCLSGRKCVVNWEWVGPVRQWKCVEQKECQ